MKGARTFGIVLLLTMVSGIVFATGNVYISNITTIPGSAHPGDVVYVLVTASNAESGTVDNIRATLQPLGNDTLEIRPINDRAEYIPPYGSVTLSFAVKIPNNAKDTYLLDLKVYTGYNEYISRTIPIFVSAPRDLLINVNSARIKAGYCSKIPVNLENISDMDIQHITVSASAAPPVYVKGDTEINEIPKGETGQITLTVCSDTDAISGIYPINLTVAYNTGSGKGVAVRQIPIYVKNTPRVIVAGITTTPQEVKEGREYDLHIILQNTSAEPAYGVQVIVDKNICNPELSGAGIADAPLYRGMYAKVSIHCKQKPPAGTLRIPILVKYRDRAGNQYTTEQNVTINVEPYPKLDIVAYYPENMYTSQTGKIIITLKNDGSATARNVSVFADPEWPFYTDQKRDYIDEIAPGEEKNAIIYMSVYPNAKSKHYGLDIRLEYRSITEDDYVTDDETLSIPVTRTNILQYTAYWIASNWLFSLLSLALIGGLIYLAARAKRE